MPQSVVDSIAKNVLSAKTQDSHIRIANLITQLTNVKLYSMVNGVRNPPIPTEFSFTGYVPPRIKHTINKITHRPDCEVIPEDDIFQYKADFVTLCSLIPYDTYMYLRTYLYDTVFRLQLRRIL